MRPRQARSQMSNTSSKPSGPAIVGVGDLGVGAARPARTSAASGPWRGRSRRAPCAAARRGSPGPSRSRGRSGRSRARVNCRATPDSGIPRALPTAWLRLSRCPPTCQSPVPALSIWIRPVSPAASTRCRITASAVGDRQMLPRQTKQITDSSRFVMARPAHLTSDRHLREDARHTCSPESHPSPPKHHGLPRAGALLAGSLVAWRLPARPSGHRPDPPVGAVASSSTARPRSKRSASR